MLDWVSIAPSHLFLDGNLVVVLGKVVVGIVGFKFLIGALILHFTLSENHRAVSLSARQN